MRFSLRWDAFNVARGILPPLVRLSSSRGDGSTFSYPIFDAAVRDIGTDVLDISLEKMTWKLAATLLKIGCFHIIS